MRLFFAVLLGGFFMAAPVQASENILPKIKFLSAEEINIIKCPKDAECIDTAALYDTRTQTIVLRDTWDPKNEYDLSVLLHEFIHHLQWLSGNAKSNCAGEREAQAYQTQRRFLETRGHKDTDAVLGVDAFTEAVLSMCGGWN